MYGLKPVDIRALTWSQFHTFRDWADARIANAMNGGSDG